MHTSKRCVSSRRRKYICENAAIREVHDLIGRDKLRAVCCETSRLFSISPILRLLPSRSPFSVPPLPFRPVPRSSAAGLVHLPFPFHYSHCAPQFCCGVPSPSRPRLPSRPAPSIVFRPVPRSSAAGLVHLPCAYIYNMYAFPIPLTQVKESPEIPFFTKKNPRKVCVFGKKCVPLHPLSTNTAVRRMPTEAHRRYLKDLQYRQTVQEAGIGLRAA